MSLESFNNIPQEDNSEEGIPKSSESVEKKKKSVKEIIERWINITGFVSASFLAGTVAYNTHERNVEYDKYASEVSMSPEDKEEFDRLNKVIVSYLGEDAIGEIRIADKKAYFQRKEANAGHKTEIAGFEGLGLDPKVTEVLFGGELFPKGWVDGEIEKIEFVQENLEGARASYDGQLDKITFYQKNKSFPEGATPGYKAEYIKSILGHEIGHANAWDTDTELDMMGRMGLLASVLTAFDTKYNLEGLSRPEIAKHVNEYWSELCMQYFNEPEHFRETEPGEFYIVHSYVLAQDPNFNVFEKAGPYFDVQGNPTQKVLDLVK